MVVQLIVAPEVVMEVAETLEMDGATPSLTVKVKLAVLVNAPPVPVTVIVELPTDVEVSVVTVIVEEQVGLHEVGEKEAVAPAGKPLAPKLTA